MTFGRVILWTAIVAFGLTALGYLVSPVVFAGAAGISLGGVGATDFRATYAGLSAGLAIFMWWCLRKPARLPAGLLMLGSVAASVALVRILGMLVDGRMTGWNLMALALEVPGALLAFAALARLHGTAAETVS